MRAWASFISRSSALISLILKSGRVAWAVASGVTVAVARLLATKGVASAYVKATGHLPPGVEDVGN